MRFGAWFALLNLAAVSAMGQPGCQTVTLAQMKDQSREDLIKSGRSVLGDGLILLGAREGGRLAFIGSAIVLFNDLLEAGKGVSTASQLRGLEGMDPNRPLSLCPAESGIAASLGFKKLSVLGPPALAQPVARGESAADSPAMKSILAQIHGFQRVQPAPDLLPRTTPRQAAPPAQVKLPRSPIFDFVMPSPSRPAALRGRVFDEGSGYPLAGATVRLTGVSVSFRDVWQGESTWGDGSFEFTNLLPGDYLLYVDEAGHYGATRRVSVQSGDQARMDVTLPAASPYPCEFTVINRTGWKVELSATDEIPPGVMAPFASVGFRISHAMALYARANFEYGPPVTWGPMRIECSGLNYANIVFRFEQ